MKAITLRFSDEEAAMLEAIARTEGRSQSSLLREAVTTLIAQRRQNKDFQEQVRRQIQQQEEMLRRLQEEP